jgi:hypothetical protein
VPFAFGDVPSNPGDTVQLSCLATKGDAPLTFSWQFNGNDLGHLPEVITTNLGDRNNMLMISPVSDFHRGTYTCMVRNRAANASHSATLTVNGKRETKILLFDILNDWL